MNKLETILEVYKYIRSIIDIIRSINDLNKEND